MVYSFSCRKVRCQRGLTFSKRLDDAIIISTGLNNWKKAGDKSREHESSQDHREAWMKNAALEQQSVVALANASTVEEQKMRRSLLIFCSFLHYNT